MVDSNALALIQRGQLDQQRLGERIRVLGIDLGTTNSTVSDATWEIGSRTPPKVTCLEIVQPTLEGEYTHALLPSIVAIFQGTQYIGEGAKRLRSRSSELALKHNTHLFYECKNDIGNRRTYHRAPEGFRSAAEISGKVLSYLRNAAIEHDTVEPSRVVITVPASFQAAQRQDTLRAAELAGLHPAAGDLIDEPVAAFLDYLITHGKELAPKLVSPRTVVVFDFGGGTCDVAVFRAHKHADGIGQLNVETLAVSRYHRLGGGDIDAAIVHDVLIPQLCKQNDIRPIDLSYEDKKLHIEPALLGLAEMLKVGLSIETRRLMSFEKYAKADKAHVVKTQPGVHHCMLGGRSLALSSSKLTASEFENVLRPFLDQDLLYARETEYRLTCSIFAPLQDALDRAGLETRSVDFCLAIGGSSLIPQVIEALTKHFVNGTVLTYPSRDDAKTCVSRGAAYHALALSAFGKPLVQPICHDEIAVRSASGLIPLVPKGALLPYPSDGSFGQCSQIAVPKTVLLEPCDLRVELVASDDERLLLRKIWSIPGPTTQGTPICLEYRIDENQVLHLRARLRDALQVGSFEAVVENPLTNVVNPQPKRLQIEQLEEDLRLGTVSKQEIPDRISEVAALYSDLGQKEKAIDFLKRAIRMKGEPDVILLNRLAGYYKDVGDSEREIRIYREATVASSWAGTWFNLSLALKRQGALKDAEEAIDRAIHLERSAPYFVQAGLIATARGSTARSKELFSEAMTLFGAVQSLSDWELGWYITAAQSIGDDARLGPARDEQRRRSRDSRASDVATEGELPIVTPALTRTRP
jgi:molecular chaperone DnaK (HSP70)